MPADVILRVHGMTENTALNHLQFGDRHDNRAEEEQPNVNDNSAEEAATRMTIQVRARMKVTYEAQGACPR